MWTAKIDRKWRAQFISTSRCDACGKLLNGRDTDVSHVVTDVHLNLKERWLDSGVDFYSICDRHRSLPAAIQQAYKRTYNRNCPAVKIDRKTA